MSAAAIATATLTTTTLTRHPFDGPISREHYQSDRLARRLELIEKAIAERGLLDGDAQRRCSGGIALEAPRQLQRPKAL